MASEDTCYIGSKTTVRGQVSGKQDLVVEGRIEGYVGLESHLTVEEGGTVEADVEAAVATLRGEVRGPVTAQRSLCVEASARVAGRLKAPTITIEDGARFSGEIEMDVELPAGVTPGNG
ncbi:MAG: polymer-forming cytoskeletal protein [Deltaproteobacteria bacterium]|nr:polymer-forming cytoskeletal protein [Deltaproteobacteria bacterium]